MVIILPHSWKRAAKETLSPNEQMCFGPITEETVLEIPLKARADCIQDKKKRIIFEIFSWKLFYIYMLVVGYSKNDLSCLL